MKNVELFVAFILFGITVQAQEKTISSLNFWNTQQKGTNMFNARPVNSVDFEAAHQYGIKFIRLTVSKYTNGRKESEKGDFLIGSMKNPSLVPVAEDLKLLIDQLDKADKAGEKVIVTLLSLPYARWSQHNKGVEERGIWESFEKQEAAITFLQNLASAIKDHPAVVGFNLRNEPSPERAKIKFADWYTGDYEKWNAEIKDSPQDLNLFYEKAVRAIRKVAPDLVLVLDSGFYAQPAAFKILKPIVNDAKIIYSFHMYAPWPFPFSKIGKVSYPGVFETGEKEQAVKVKWDKAEMEKFFEPVRAWQKQYAIPDNQILAGEFGVNRHAVGAKEYLTDCIDLFNQYNWHWAFYSFREDEWDVMDYELGSGKVSAQYWENLEKGLPQDYSKISDNPLFKVIKNDLKK